VHPDRVVVVGVAGSGKSTAARELARRRRVPYVEADDFHSQSNLEMMASGTPLTDQDRWPWLAAVRQAMRSKQDVVVACSALRRDYREALRRADGVRFVHLVADPDGVVERVRGRPGHFLGVDLVQNQFETLEPPEDEETDIVSVSSRGDPMAVVDRIEAALANVSAGTAASPTFSDGDPDRAISTSELRGLVTGIATTQIVGAGAKRVLLVPPDHTRLHSRCGEVTGTLFEVLRLAGCEVSVLPALGTHEPMTPEESTQLFGTSIPSDRILRHRWREGLEQLGTISAAEVSAVSEDRLAVPIPIEVDRTLLDGWDVVVSVGQVVPHEVIGMANYSKNLVIGLGGAPTIHGTHFLGAVCGMENVMGRASNPVRDVVDAALDRFVVPRVPVLWLLTVMEDTPDGVVQRGLFVGHGGSSGSGGAAFRDAAALAVRCNIDLSPHPLPRISCWLDPEEFTTAWLANKAVYRTRMALMDGGELLVLAPGVTRFGEDATIDRLIRRHGYRGTPATINALQDDPELADNLGAAAHLVHGSSEGRFRIVYCTDPTAGGLTREEVEGVGYEWRSLPDTLDLLHVTPETPTGSRVDGDGSSFEHIANPALGLWATTAAFT
jgi:carbohydrate kinase (thermoresistant glucokinase family)